MRTRVRRRRVVRGAAAAMLVVGVAGATLALEVVMALRRDYIRTAPAAEIGGTFGPPNGAYGQPLRFAVLGDSTAAGLGAGSAGRSYPVLLARRLGDAGFRVELIDLGVSGARTADVAATQAPRAAAGTGGGPMRSIPSWPAPWRASGPEPDERHTVPDGKDDADEPGVGGDGLVERPDGHRGGLPLVRVDHAASPQRVVDGDQGVG